MLSSPLIRLHLAISSTLTFPSYHHLHHHEGLTLNNFLPLPSWETNFEEENSTITSNKVTISDLADRRHLDMADKLFACNVGQYTSLPQVSTSIHI